MSIELGNCHNILKSVTTAQLADFITRFGATGTEQVNAIAPGQLLYNSTTNAVVVFNGTSFVTVTAA